MLQTTLTNTSGFVVNSSINDYDLFHLISVQLHVKNVFPFTRGHPAMGTLTKLCCHLVSINI